MNQMTERDMREVVQRLRVENSEALLELGEFKQAVTELFRAVETLAHLCTGPGTTARERVSEFVGTPQGSSHAMQSATERLLSAFSELRKGVEGWAISKTPGASAEREPRGTN